MKNLFLLMVVAMWILSSCGRDMEVSTKFSDDGTVERTLLITSKKDERPKHTVFGVLDEQWDYEFLKGDTSKEIPSKMKLYRKFKTIEEVNEVMNQDSDTLWQIATNLESEFRWFFTYFTFSETYGALDRLKFVEQQDYFTQEDYQFIERMEPGQLNAADSLYLGILQGKMEEHYFIDSWKSEWRQALNDLFVKQSLQNWVDSLDAIMMKVVVDEMDEEEVADLLIKWEVPMDSSLIATTLEQNMREATNRLEFINDLYGLSLTHDMEVPGEIVRSNAHKIDGNSATWYPPSVAYCLKPLELYATYRTLNWWAVIVSVLFVMMTIFLFIKKR